MFFKSHHGAAGPAGTMPQPDAPSFGYLFPDAPPAPQNQDRLKALDELGQAMIDQGGDADRNAMIPPVFTYLGQFIDHDITAGTDREQLDGRIEDPDLKPVARAMIVQMLRNERSARLDLDSLYGNVALSADAAESPVNRAFLERLSKLMRFPADIAKMRIAFFEQPDGGVDLPLDRAGDLLRLDRLLSAQDGVTKEDLDKLDGRLRMAFLDKTGAPITQRAILGDARNDENLIVAQLHLAFLRLHNRLVDTCDDVAVLDEGREAVFRYARRNATWIYQWLVANVYLPAVCNPEALAAVRQGNAALYTAFRDRVPAQGDQLPLPLEFSVAAFRFGHTMVRARYDWNRFFGRSGNGPSIQERASFEDLFAFTGNGRLKGFSNRLPSIWGADWDRMIGEPTPAFPDRAARRIDTQISQPLFDLPDGRGPGMNAILASLARRNLRRGYQMNLPTAQACIDGVEASLGLQLPRLTEAQMGDGLIGQALDRGDLRGATPLWFYVLREAEVLEDGMRLGPLGTHLVAGTLLGLIVADPESYWNQPGSDGGRWHPVDGPQPAGKPVDTLRGFFEAGLLL